MFVKIDGVTSLGDAVAAVEAGADAVGFIFAPSVRQVGVAEVAPIVQQLPPDVLALGVFVDAPRDHVARAASAAGLGAVQLHGREPAEDVRWIRARVPFVMKAFAAGDPLLSSAGVLGVDAVVVDHPHGGGGTGEAYDWTLATVGVPDGMRIVLAGGLTPDNVAAAIAAARPWGVDVSSGVEASPGRKDPEKLRAFVAAARAASSS